MSALSLPRSRDAASSVAAPLLALGVGALLAAPLDLALPGRLALVTFAVAIHCWVATDLPDTKVALAAVGVLVAGGALEAPDLAGVVADPTVWLLAGSFVIAAAAGATGLAARLAATVAARAGTVQGLFWRLTAALGLTAFVIPSTSGRAALAVPVFLALAAAIDDRRVVRALALLFPAVILLSAVASLIGAGAHLVTAGLVERAGGGELGFARWALLGTPFAVASCALTTWVILREFLGPEQRTAAVRLRAADLGARRGPLDGAEWRVLAVVAALVALWCTEPLHGVPAAAVAVAGAVAVVAPRVGAIRPRAGAEGIDFGLLAFLAATLLLGAALVDTGAARWLADGAFAAAGGWLSASPVAAVAVVAAVSLAAHLAIVSRTARSSVLVPIVLALAGGLGLEPAALAFLSTAAAGFCLTLPVSAKPVLMFSRLDGDTYAPADLLRLARILAPVHLVLLVAFAVVVWPALGLELVGR